MRDSDSQLPLKIVPKGLRLFDKEDKDFFLELLPGPRDREGLPDSIRFWKTRIEEENSDATFPVGVMYGPSEYGKSTMVKAGLLPHLAAQVLPFYIEAAPHDTELRLLRTLLKNSDIYIIKMNAHIGRQSTTVTQSSTGNGLIP